MITEKVVDVKNTPFVDYGQIEWAMYFIEQYGQIDGSNHKAWVLDQVARILKGTDVIVTCLEYENGTKNYYAETGAMTDEYKQWVLSMQFDENGEKYPYDEGIAP